MTIQDLGSIGELIAAIATVATLGYLAVQIRQNTRTIRGSEVAYRSNLEMATNARFFDLRRDVYSDPELASIWARGLIDPEMLVEGEWNRFFNYFTSWVFAMGEQYRIQTDLLVDRQTIFTPVFQDMFRFPGARKAWHAGFGYDPEFTEFLNGIYEATRANTPSELKQNPSSFLPTPPASD